MEPSLTLVGLGVLADTITLPHKLDHASDNTDVEESCSTAAPSLMPSPIGGPLGAPDYDFQLDTLGLDLSTEFTGKSSEHDQDIKSPVSSTGMEIGQSCDGVFDIAAENKRNAHVGYPSRASKEGAPWPCVEWLTADPNISEACLDWLSSDPDPQEVVTTQPSTRRKRGPYGKDLKRGDVYKNSHAITQAPHYHGVGFDIWPIAFESEFDIDAEFPNSTAWTRFSDDAYPTSGASLLGW